MKKIRYWVSVRLKDGTILAASVRAFNEDEAYTEFLNLRKNEGIEPVSHKVVIES